MKIPFFSSSQRKEPGEEEIKMIPTAQISPNPYQPRTDFKEEELKELAKSIETHGMIQPLTVTEHNDGGYQLIAGERRLKAVKLLGQDKIPAVIREFNDQEMAEIALIENLQRKDLYFLEEARAYQTLLDRFSLTQQELAESLGKSQSTIANKLRLLSLPGPVRRKITTEGLTERQARSLLKLKEADEMLEAVDRIAEEDLTVREAERMVEGMLAGARDRPADKEKKKKTGRIQAACADVRLYINSLEKTLEEIEKSGGKVEVERLESEEEIEFQIKLKKSQTAEGGGSDDG